MARRAPMLVVFAGDDYVRDSGKPLARFVVCARIANNIVIICILTGTRMRPGHPVSTGVDTVTLSRFFIHREVTLV